MSESPDLPSSIGVLLRLLNQNFSMHVGQALAEAGFGDLGQMHSNVFTFVPEEGIQVSELATLARVRKQTMAQAVEELEKRGYIERHPDPSDKRGRLVFLTEKGKQVRPTAMQAGEKVEAHWSELLGEKELEDLRRLLQTLLRKLSEEGPA
ncbi:MarR family winged helix-turn-helix transcriptional regulator [Deinococcus cellulosilyticus]|uniref:HTH marR-type domain-containing protein n=1 Tax=Deinococcus cellulosilyticus (strain DSM 18568 / NBRC 106333 / KACC 11606 / 5516J-15) TaxID=1223518 RepID=A0A511N0B3_DEIC1|nr:MarR family winged helix-turn-helix transcriptional regulator [Deinococcus cellulosilyticus]GEM46284.1 hypothetical protein DC3_19190 [Deinococcus cellulosilyticus NBRC 106333 = KACC 11606]